MSKSRSRRSRDDAEHTGTHTRASRLRAIGKGQPDPVANDEDEVLTRQGRLEAIGAGEPDPVNEPTEDDAA